MFVHLTNFTTAPNFLTCWFFLLLIDKVWQRQNNFCYFSAHIRPMFDWFCRGYSLFHNSLPFFRVQVQYGNELWNGIYMLPRCSFEWWDLYAASFFSVISHSTQKKGSFSLQIINNKSVSNKYSLEYSVQRKLKSFILTQFTEERVALT